MSNRDLRPVLSVWPDAVNLIGRGSAEMRMVPVELTSARFEAPAKTGRLTLIASPTGAEGSVRIHQDARIFASILDGEQKLSHALQSGRRAFVHVVRGTVTANGQPLGPGDAAKITAADAVELSGARSAELLLFDLP